MKAERSVTYLITASDLGGAEVQVRDLAIAMHSRGWRTNAISMVSLGSVFHRLPDAGVPIATLGMHRGVADPRAVWRLRTLLRQQRPRILHAHMVHANLLARLVRLVYPEPIVISTMHSQQQGPRWRNVAYRLTDRLGACSTAVSHSALEDAVRSGIAPRARLLYMPNGIDTKPYRQDPEVRDRARRDLGVGDGFLWLAAGRLVDAKDYPNMIEAFARVLDRTDLTGRLLIAGDGDDDTKVRLRHQVEFAGISAAVDILGVRHDIPALMQAADGFVMSSAWEGMPMALLEAGASGLPAVVTDVGGSRDIVTDGRSGYIVPPADPVALAAAMVRLMQLPAEHRRSIGAAARDHIRTTFDMDAVASRWDVVYQDLIAGRG